MKDILKQIEVELQTRALDDEGIAQILSSYDPITQRRIIGGYASVSIVDREGQRITIAALSEAVKRFMRESNYKNANVFHSNVTIGRVLPKWTNPETGETYKTKVDDTGWFCLVEIRDDVELANKVWEEIQRGTLRSFSISGSSKKKSPVYDHGMMVDEVEELDIFEVTICEEPVNPMSKFDMLWNPNAISI